MKQIEPWMPEKLELIEETITLLLESKACEERIEEKLWKKIAACDEDFSTICISKVRFENCNFLDCSFKKGEFTDVIFQSCNFSNCDFDETYFNRCRFLSSKGIGTKFTGSSIQNVTIADSNFDYANFDASKLENFKIEHTELNSGNVTQCRCKNVVWDHVQLVNTSFFGTSLNKMDFTTCTIAGVVLSDDCRELKGAIVDLYQAAELAKRLGVVIK